jgi:hypothetical protein
MLFSLNRLSILFSVLGCDVFLRAPIAPLTALSEIIALALSLLNPFLSQNSMQNGEFDRL